MIRLPRLLAIMGSGETSPTMVKTHRELLGRLGPSPVPAVLLDTPFGFQENADDIAAKAVEYFRESVGAPMGVASFRSAAAVDPLVYDTLATARYVFAGPGSPSYALRQWRGSPVPELLGEKLRSGGCVTFASAAALTLGVVTVPVYEIYKVGEPPAWLEGLDLLREVGLRAAVIPHFNNAEGGNHDTRFCYLGERRLAVLEQSLPDDAFVLGVDEHTGLVLDLDAGSATVVGLGVVTVRRPGAGNVTYPAGSVVALSELGSASSARVSAAPAKSTGDESSSPLLDTVAELEAGFAAALAADDGPGAARAVLELESQLVAWSRDTLQSDEMDRGRAALRSMIVRLGQAARPVGPFVEALLAQRAAAREGGRWADADALRDALVALGVEINDSPKGTAWRLLS